MLFTKKTNAETSTLNDVSSAITSALLKETPGTDLYERLLGELTKVEELKANKTKQSYSFKPSADVLVNGLFTLISVGAIVKHEQLAVITSKAVGFLPKLLK